MKNVLVLLIAIVVSVFVGGYLLVRVGIDKLRGKTKISQINALTGV